MSRLRQLVAGSEPEIQAYDQDAWAAGLPYHLPIDRALAVLDAVRAYSLLTLDALDDADWAKAGRHAEHDEPYTVEAWLEIYAEHPYEHAAQITAARASAGERAVTS